MRYLKMVNVLRQEEKGSPNSLGQDHEFSKILISNMLILKNDLKKCRTSPYNFLKLSGICRENQRYLWQKWQKFRSNKIAIERLLMTELRTSFLPYETYYFFPQQMRYEYYTKLIGKKGIYLSLFLYSTIHWYCSRQPAPLLLYQRLKRCG